jgi:dephospho-CoA kinase
VLKVGLTGGLGCGKSTVTSLFADKGVAVLDADLIARELVEPGQSAFNAIVDQFGSDVLEKGRINRARLRDRVYANREDRLKLEGIIHPLVYRALSDQAKTLASPYCIFAIPLLIETGREDFVDRILVVDCRPDQQYERVRQRDNLDDDAIVRIIQAQASREEKLAAASDIIENTGGIEQLREQVDKLHRAYLVLANKYP